MGHRHDWLIGEHLPQWRTTKIHIEVNATYSTADHYNTPICRACVCNINSACCKRHNDANDAEAKDRDDAIAGECNEQLSFGHSYDISQKYVTSR